MTLKRITGRGVFGCSVHHQHSLYAMFHLETYNILQRQVQHLLQPKRYDDNTEWTTETGKVEVATLQPNSQEKFLDFQLKGNCAKTESQCFSQPNK